MKKEELFALISAYIDLKEDDSVCCDGMDKVDISDVTVLAQIIQEIIELRFRRDVDGYLPIDYQLINRNIQQWILFGNATKHEKTPREVYMLASASESVAKLASNAALSVMIGEDDE